ncbi:hypothetical protein EZV62_002281 [Acer yangbiense]|uniref:Photosystem I n=1 Tax=Acer yangbiense TaxID=1000413 RepID=A0A5C7IYL9_9ROSI|nr:hypothetical protein EZV62_002281 [Acer yangbiense]
MDRSISIRSAEISWDACSSSMATLRGTVSEDCLTCNPSSRFSSSFQFDSGEILEAATYDKLLASTPEFQDLVNALYKNTSGGFERHFEFTSNTSYGRWIELECWTTTIILFGTCNIEEKPEMRLLLVSVKSRCGALPSHELPEFPETRYETELYKKVEALSSARGMERIASQHQNHLWMVKLLKRHMYRTDWGIGYGLKEILEAYKGPFIGQGHIWLYEILTTSWHAQLSLNLAMLGSLTIVVAHHIYSMPPYPYLAIEYGTQMSLFTHHIWIGGFLIVGVAAHAAIFMVCIFLGFHSFGLYIHNDTMSTLGRPQDMFLDTAIQLQPIFAQWIENTYALAPGGRAPDATTSTSLTWGGGDLVAVGGKVALLPIPLGTVDFLVHHIHAFTIHVTVLIRLKGVLFARSSRLKPDKANLGFRFPCYGPGIGGTCQVSAWGHVFLGLFWMYNAIFVVIFHFSWKCSQMFGVV